MPRTATTHPSSSRNSIYSLQTFPRSPSVPPRQSMVDHGVSSAPPRRSEATETSAGFSRDEFLPQDVDRYDRIWGDMAARMGDLDTSITRPATDIRLVSEAHAKSVEQLRDAQIRLAETWAGSESRLGTNQSSLLAKLAQSAAGTLEAEISDEERSRLNDQIFQQMEHEVGIVMGQLDGVIRAQEEVEKVSRDMWKTTLSIAHFQAEKTPELGNVKEEVKEEEQS